VAYFKGGVGVFTESSKTAVVVNLCTRNYMSALFFKNNKKHTTAKVQKYSNGHGGKNTTITK